MEHNQIIRAPGVNLGVAARVASGLRDSEEGLSRLSESLECNLNLLEEEEFHIFRRAYLCAGAMSLAAVAASIAKAMIFNPAGSGYLVILRRMQLGSGTAQKLYRSTNNSIVGWTHVGTGLVDMDRRSARSFSVAQKYTLNDATTPGGTLDGMLTPANTMLELTVPCIIPPGQGIYGACNVVNTNLECAVVVEERPADAYELIPGGL